MGKPYSEGLQARVVVAEQDGATIRETAERFGVSISSVVRLRRLHRKTDSVSPAQFGGYKGYVPAAHEDLVGNWWRSSRMSRWRRSKPFWATEKRQSVSPRAAKRGAITEPVIGVRGPPIG
jgi:transposase